MRQSQSGRPTSEPRDDAPTATPPDLAADGSDTRAESWTVDTPVVLVVFNRPDTTAQVFDRIAAVEPPELYVIADGPRADHADDEALVAAVRDIVECVDWDCEVNRLYRDRNVGLPRSVYEGLDWVFDQVPEAIILEDDTLPNVDFFRFCESLLDQYRDDERVMSINGTNRLGTWRADRQDYHFVTWQGVWGWATWRDAWESYDPEIRAWANPQVRDHIRHHIADEERYEYHRDLFDTLYEEEVTGWSRAWRFAMFRNAGLSAVPARNLVSNIGFDERGQYTTNPDSPLANLPRRTLEFPLEHPEAIAPDREYERTCFDRFRRTGRLERFLAAVPNPIFQSIPNNVKRAAADRYL